jgi:hypothetical protein
MGFGWVAPHAKSLGQGFPAAQAVSHGVPASSIVLFDCPLFCRRCMLCRGLGHSVLGQGSFHSNLHLQPMAEPTYLATNCITAHGAISSQQIAGRQQANLLAPRLARSRQWFQVDRSWLPIAAHVTCQLGHFSKAPETPDLLLDPG